MVRAWGFAEPCLHRARDLSGPLRMRDGRGCSAPAAWRAPRRARDAAASTRSPLLLQGE